MHKFVTTTKTSLQLIPDCWDQSLSTLSYRAHLRKRKNEHVVVLASDKQIMELKKSR